MGSGLDGAPSAKGSKSDLCTICILALWVRGLLKMRLLDLSPDLLICSLLLVWGKAENSLPGTTAAVAPSMCHEIAKTKEIKEREKKLFIFLLMEIISRGHDIGWV